MSKIVTFLTPVMLDIQLSGVTPEVCRRIVVPSHISLSKLSDALQIAMGWAGSHLHTFIINHKRFGIPDPDFLFAQDILDQRYKRFTKVLGNSTNFTYVYDFSDQWQHEINLKPLEETNFPADKITLVSGHGACPPEDIGGVLGFTQFKRIMADKQHPEYADMRCWYGREFAVDMFDANRTQAALNKIKL